MGTWSLPTLWCFHLPRSVVKLCALFQSEHVGARSLLPGGANMTVDPNICSAPAVVITPFRVRLGALIRSSSKGCLAFLLCSALSSGDEASLPSDAMCGLILEVCSLYDRASDQCKEMSEPMRHLPPSFWGRLSRSAGCLYRASVCSTHLLYVASHMPSLLCGPTEPVGYLYDLDSSFSITPSSSTSRLVSFSLSQRIGPGAALCDLRLRKSSHCRFFFLDCPAAAAAFPYRFAELRTLLRTPGLLFYCKNGYYLYQLSVMDSQGLRSVQAPPLFLR